MLLEEDRDAVRIRKSVVVTPMMDEMATAAAAKQGHNFSSWVRTLIVRELIPEVTKRDKRGHR
jgi:hypothetical protein